MTCAWKEFLAILPLWMRGQVDLLGRDTLQELRLRINGPPELICAQSIQYLSQNVSREDLEYCINTATRYSPWTASTMSKGYITAVGGHRIGLCGNAVIQNGSMKGIRDPRSVCIRIARDFPGIAQHIPANTGNTLILGAPGWGKTTLLRDLCRRISNNHRLCVMDERGELFPEGIPTGRRMDILTGCPKTIGVEILLRTMGPEYIAVDEITAQEDCDALIHASYCGIHLLATAHAASLKDYQTRKIYQSLTEQSVFQSILLLHPDKTYVLERIHS